MPRDPNTGKRIVPNRPREVVREELFADPHTKNIADSLKMELNRYVELVLDYAYNPEKDVVLHIASDEDLKAAGYDPPSGDTVGKWIRSAAQKIAGKIALNKITKSGFDEAAPDKSAIGVPETPTAADTAQPAGTPREDLINDIKKHRGTKG